MMEKPVGKASGRTQRIIAVLQEVGLEDSMKTRYPHEFSGGQRQRTAILSQILSSGYFLVLDEPFSGLDVGNVEDVKSMLRLVNASHELSTIIFSTHDIELAVELADKIYVIGFPSEDRHVGTIVSAFDLKALGLAWQSYGKEHIDLVHEIKKKILASEPSCYSPTKHKHESNRSRQNSLDFSNSGSSWGRILFFWPQP